MHPCVRGVNTREREVGTFEEPEIAYLIVALLKSYRKLQRFLQSFGDYVIFTTPAMCITLVSAGLRGAEGKIQTHQK